MGLQSHQFDRVGKVNGEHNSMLVYNIKRAINILTVPDFLNQKWKSTTKANLFCYYNDLFSLLEKIIKQDYNLLSLKTALKTNKFRRILFKLLLIFTAFTLASNFTELS
jgi:hypothetical protein